MAPPISYAVNGKQYMRDRPVRGLDVLRLDTMPILQSIANTGPSASLCSLSRRPGEALARTEASVALRTSSASRRRSSPFDQNRGGVPGWRDH
jgi:hypothetical protein